MLRRLAAGLHVVAGLAILGVGRIAPAVGIMAVTNGRRLYLGGGGGLHEQTALDIGNLEIREGARRLIDDHRRLGIQHIGRLGGDAKGGGDGRVAAGLWVGQAIGIALQGVIGRNLVLMGIGFTGCPPEGTLNVSLP